MSPVDKNWPARPYIFLDGVHKELQKIFHLWRVGHYCFCARHCHAHQVFLYLTTLFTFLLI